MTTGNGLLKLAETRLGEKYRNVVVPKDNQNGMAPGTAPNLRRGRCQKVDKLYGCPSNSSKPAVQTLTTVLGHGTRKTAHFYVLIDQPQTTPPG